jgi:hypothetical protein
MSEDTHSDRADYASAGYRPSSPNGHEDINRARQAAEALFAPRRQIENPANLDATGSAQQDVRKPRILSAVRERQPQAAHLEATKPRPKHKIRRPRKRVPATQLARVRTWLNYGMTIDQAADLYGVSESEIERIVQKA